MTFADVIQEVSGNLGNRASGVIGGQNTTTVVMRGINNGLLQCVKLANPTYYERATSVSIPMGSSQEIAMPEVDGLKVNDILTAKLIRDSDGTTVNIVRMLFKEYKRANVSEQEARTGVPSSWAIWGDTIYINRIPQEDYSLHLYCEMKPKLLTSADLYVEMPMGAEWTLAVEAFATAYCFSKLQQFESATYWENMFKEQKASNTRVKRKMNAKGADGTAAHFQDDCVLDPFCHSNRLQGGY